MGYTPPALNVRKISGGDSVSSTSVAASDRLMILPNAVSLTTGVRIVVNAHNQIQLVVEHGTPLRLSYHSGGITYSGADLFFSATDGIDIRTTDGNKNIKLTPHGTGKVKFGTHTAAGDAASDGFIEIVDAGGTTRKLMTRA